MLIYAKSVIGLPVVESVTMKTIGHVANIIVAPENGRVIAFLLKKNLLFSKTKIVMPTDVVNFFTDAVLVREHGSIILPEEVIRVKEVLDKKIYLIGSQVFTQNGQYLGTLEDFIFDTNLSTLSTLTTRKRFSQDKRIIDAKRISSIHYKKIIIIDALGKVNFNNFLNKLKRLVDFIPATK